MTTNGHDTTGFDKSLAFGHEAEYRVARAFWNKGFLAFAVNEDQRFDICVFKDSLPYLVEIKCEDKYAHTGNICIEMFQGRMETYPSGIAISESTVIIHAFCESALIYRTQPMRLWLRQEAMAKRITLDDFRAADNGNKGYIIPITQIIYNNPSWAEYCHIEELPTSKIFFRQKAPA